MATNIATWADLGPVKIRCGPAEPVRVRVTSNLSQMPKPDLSRIDTSPEKGFFGLTGELFLVLQPHLNGMKWWLCGSWMLEPDASNHESILREDEPSDCEIFSLNSLKLSSRWAVSRIQFFDFRIQHTHMDQLTSVMGDPMGQGLNFFNRLLPGRLPAAVRCRSNNWQIWLQL
jgi:hypothetical protein